MAGTMPHAIFVETGLDDGAVVAAYAAELPGCAVFAATDDEAAGAMPMRVSAFTGWLRDQGEAVPAFVGDNWYEVERAAAAEGRRAGFTLDELPPSAEEFALWPGDRPRAQRAPDRGPNRPAARPGRRQVPQGGDQAALKRHRQA